MNNECEKKMNLNTECTFGDFTAPAKVEIIVRQSIEYVMWKIWFFYGCYRRNYLFRNVNGILTYIGLKDIVCCWERVRSSSPFTLSHDELYLKQQKRTKRKSGIDLMIIMNTQQPVSQFVPIGCSQIFIIFISNSIECNRLLQFRNFGIHISNYSCSFLHRPRCHWLHTQTHTHTHNAVVPIESAQFWNMNAYNESNVFERTMKMPVLRTITISWSWHKTDNSRSVAIITIQL